MGIILIIAAHQMMETCPALTGDALRFGWAAQKGQNFRIFSRFWGKTPDPKGFLRKQSILLANWAVLSGKFASKGNL